MSNNSTLPPDGYKEDLDEYRYRVWKMNSDGKSGFWVTDRKYSDAYEREPLNCPVCKAQAIKFSPDAVKAYRKWGCCHHCEIEHVEGNEGAWKEGWRPDKEHIDYWVAKRNKKSWY